MLRDLGLEGSLGQPVRTLSGGMKRRVAILRALAADYDVLLCPLVTAWYLLTELGSIAENAGALGAPMPQFLMRAIAALRAGISDRGGGDGDGGGAA